MLQTLQLFPLSESAACDFDFRLNHYVGEFYTDQKEREREQKEIKKRERRERKTKERQWLWLSW